MFKKILLISTALLLSAGVYAEEKKVKTVEKQYEEWAASLKERCDKNGNVGAHCDESNLVYGDGFIAVSPQNPKWVNKRNDAYNEALVEAYIAYATEVNLRETTEILNSFNTDSEDPELPSNQKDDFDVILDKIIAVTSGELDAKLIELGIDPNEYKKSPTTVKKDMLSEKLITKNIEKATSTLIGLIPYTTFEGLNDSNEHTIRVVLLKDSEKMDLLKSIYAYKEKVMPNTSKKAKTSVYDRFVKQLSKEELFRAFGTRMSYDEEGYPVLISYGQAGIEKSVGSLSKKLKTKSARKLAIKRARSGFSLLLNSNINYESQTFENSIEKEVKTIKQEGKMGVKSTQEVAESILKQSIKSRINADIDFPGISTLHTWTYTHPQYKHNITGVVMMWSPKTAQNSKDMTDAQAKPVSELNSLNDVDERPSRISSEVIKGIESDF